MSLLIPEGDMQPVVYQAIRSVFANQDCAGLARVSPSFKEKCATLLTSVRKPTLLKSVVNGMEYVLSGQISEAVFLKKYC